MLFQTWTLEPIVLQPEEFYMSGAHSLCVSGCVQALGLRQPLKPALNLAQVEVCALWSHKHTGTRQTCVSHMETVC